MSFGDIASAAAAYAGYSMGGPAGAALGSAALNYVGAQETNDANAARADAANAWSANQYANRYQTMVKDLEAAGLNPMLAYSQSPGSAPSAQQVTFQNPMSAATQGYGQVASAQQGMSEIERNKHLNEYTDQQVVNLKEEFKNIPLKGNEINAFVAKLEQERQLLLQKKLTEIEVGNHFRKLIDKVGKETDLLSNQVEVERSLNNIGRYSKELGPMAQLLLNIFRSSK